MGNSTSVVAAVPDVSAEPNVGPPLSEGSLADTTSPDASLSSECVVAVPDAETDGPVTTGASTVDEGAAGNAVVASVASSLDVEPCEVLISVGRVKLERDSELCEEISGGVVVETASGG